MNEELKFLGLTDNEIKIYCDLLKNGKSNGSQLRRRTGIANSRVYASIDNLIEMGLVNFEITPRGKIYSAENPNIIKEIFKEHMSKIEKIVPQLKSLQRSEKSLTKSAIYQGFNGFKTAFNRSVDECPKNASVFIIGFSNQAYKNERLRHLLFNINKKAIKKKHRFKMILDNKGNIFYKDRKLEGISEVKFMNNGFSSPAAINIFKESVYFFLWDEEPYAFMIQNRSLALGFRNYFNFLWQIAEK